MIIVLLESVEEEKHLHKGVLQRPGSILGPLAYADMLPSKLLHQIAYNGDFGKESIGKQDLILHI